MNMQPSPDSLRAELDGPSIVSLTDVEMTYGRGATAVRAVRQVSLDVRRGEVLFLTGPSGSGKTSLLQIIGLLISPTAGRISICGTELGKLSQRQMSDLRRAHCGFIFQSYNLFPTLTALENVLVACELKGVPRAEARDQAWGLLDRVGLGAKRDSYPATLSGGQKQRVAVARALAGNPPLILADEPTAALDQESGQQVTALLCGLAHEDHRALVIVTHDPRISGYADRIVTLQDGLILETKETPEG
jgi:putative ABC transport system ATP-binding protein